MSTHKARDQQPQPLRAGIALRLSHSTKESTSIERQQELCRDYADRNGWTIVAEPPADLDVSAFKVPPWNRPAIRAILDRDDVDVLITWKLDRVIRRAGDLQPFLDRLDARGVRLVAVNDSLDFSTAAGRMTANIMASVAQHEAEVTGERVAAARKHMRERGRWSGGRVPFGFMTVPTTDGKALAADPGTGPIVQEMARRAIDGESLYSIANDLNQRGEGGGRRWTRTTVGELLRNPLIAGTMMHAGRPVLGSDGLPVICASLISRETFNELQQVLRDRSQRGRHPRSDSPALVRPVCGKCGYRCFVSGTRAKRKYQCGGHSVANGCTGVAVVLDQVDKYVEHRFLERYGDWIRLDSPPAPDTTATAELDQVEAAIDQLVEDRYTHGLFSDTGRYVELMTRLERRRDDLRAEVDSQPAATDIDLVEIGTVADFWSTADLRQRREYLTEWVTVTVKPGHRGKPFNGDDRLVLDWIPDECDNISELFERGPLAKPPEGDPWRTESRARWLKKHPPVDGWQEF